MIGRRHVLSDKPICWLYQSADQKNGEDGWFFGRYRQTMNSLGHRLREAREAAGLTQSQLAERVGMAGQQSIEAIEVGRSKNPTKIYEIAKACNVTVEWLQGRSDIGPAKRKSPTASDLSSRSSRIDAIKSEDDAQRDASAIRMLPEIDLLAGASYGGGKSDQEWQDGGQAGDKHIAQWGLPASFVQRELGLQFGQADILQVRGDSMDDGTAKGLSSGDRVIIDRRDTDPRQGGIFAVFDGDGVIIKQVELLRDQDTACIICKSRNTAYDPIVLKLDGSVKIIGRIAGVISRR